MKLVIVGGVAGGASAAARARRLSEDAHIILIERGEHVSFANCGLPYYIGGEIEEKDDLLVSTPEKLRDRFRIDVRVMQEVVSIDLLSSSVRIRDISGGQIYDESYDRLILAPGASPIRPPFPGADLEGVHVLRTVPDSEKIKERVARDRVKSAVVIGGGFIGLEMAENLARAGVKVSIVEMVDQVMAPLDFEMASQIHEHLMEKGVSLRLRDGVKSCRKDGGSLVVETNSGCELECDMVILSIGVRPEIDLARAAGLEIGSRGGIKTDQTMRTSDPRVFAVGDAVEVRDFVSGLDALIPLAGPANRQGRVAADNALGRASMFKGVQGTSVVKIFELTAGATGINEKRLKSIGRPYLASFIHSNHHVSYYPGAERMAIKLLFDPGDGRILGAQAIGKKGVDKRIDVLATAIRAGLTVFDLEELELAYAPPFGAAKDPINVAGMAAANALKRDMETIHWDEIAGMGEDSHVLIDLRDPDELEDSPPLPGSVNIPLNDLRSRLPELDKEKTYVLYCAIGQRGYYGYRIMAMNGFKARNLSGGMATSAPALKQKEWINRGCRVKED